MKNSLLLVAALAVVCGCATTDLAGSSGRSVDKEIAALDDEALSAYFRGDTVTLRRLEADNFIVIGDEGKAFSTTGRYESIDRQVKEGKWFQGGVARTNESRTIRVFGPTAIVHGVAVVNTHDTQERVAFSEVWNHRNGSWRFVHLHFHSLKGPQSPTEDHH